MVRIQIYPDRSQFGWPGDNGLGERLIGQILRGDKTATCSPKEGYTQAELAELLGTKGKVVTVVDQLGHAHCNIRIIDVFETTFGSPDPRLVRGEGLGEDSAEFQAVHRTAWAAEVAQGMRLDQQTVLMVELFERVETP